MCGFVCVGLYNFSYFERTGVSARKLFFDVGLRVDKRRAILSARRLGLKTIMTLERVAKF